MRENEIKAEFDHWAAVLEYAFSADAPSAYSGLDISVRGVSRSLFLTFETDQKPGVDWQSDSISSITYTQTNGVWLFDVSFKYVSDITQMLS